jgi:hypothetical protein
MTNVMCLGTFFEDYKDNYDVLGISTDLDFDKLHEYFTKKIKYFDLFLKTENITFPKNLNEFTSFVEKIRFREFNYRFAQPSKENVYDFFAKYPEINDFFEDNLTELKLHPEKNRVHPSFKQLSMETLEDQDLRPRNASYCFCDAMPDIILYEDIYEMFRYAQQD